MPQALGARRRQAPTGRSPAQGRTRFSRGLLISCSIVLGRSRLYRDARTGRSSRSRMGSEGERLRLWQESAGGGAWASSFAREESRVLRGRGGYPRRMARPEEDSAGVYYVSRADFEARAPARPGPKEPLEKCDECGSEYYAAHSQMARLCPECAHLLYGYPTCTHFFADGRCVHCYWDGSAAGISAPRP